MGTDGLLCQQLASANLALSCSRLPTLRSAARWPSRKQSGDPCCECSPAVLAPTAVDGSDGTQRIRRGTVRASSTQRGVGRMDRRTQECTKYNVLPADA